jgi:mannose-1-phosphate guanylyltransferase
MKAMILAAGKGTRVQPLTYEMPKPMVPILGKPVMEYLVENLARHGFRDIMVNVSHLPQQIERYFGDGRRWGVRIGYSFEGHIHDGRIVSTPLGSAGGIKRIQDFSAFFDDTFAVVCGDALIDLDLTRALRLHWQNRAKASVCVHKVAPARVSDYGVVVCDDDGRISSFQEKPAVEDARSNLVNTGIYIFEPEVLDLIPAQQEYDIGGQLFPQIVAHEMPFYAIHEPFNWVDIGRLSDYWEANQQLMQGKLRDIRMPGKEVRPGVWTGINVQVDWNSVKIQGPVFIGSSSRIESGCEIVGPTWVEHGCHIQKGASVTRSILFEHSRIGASGCVEDSIVFGRYCVDKEGRPVTDAQLGWVGDARSLDPLPAVAAAG